MEKMTLVQLSERLRKYPIPGYVETCNLWADNIDADLAKQREAEPVGEVTGDGFPMLYGHKPLQPKTKLYTHPQQRNAVEVTDELCRRLIAKLPLGASAYLHVENVREALETTLSAVASRDREDAEHQLRDLHRAIESNLTGTSIEQGKSPTEYKDGLIKAYGHCRDMVSRRIDAIRAVRNAVDAARRENKP
jgi:hypothetical protein